MATRQVGNPLYNEVRLSTGEAYSAGSWRDMPEVVHDDEQIKGFFGEYRWLSNFGKADIVLDGTTYSSVERAYQAAKWRSVDRRYFETCSNEGAIKYNRTHTPNGYSHEEWDAVKLDVMEFLLLQKFDERLNPGNHDQLVATGGRYLEETNWWGDVYWGRNLAGEGENNLGNLLMQIRQKLFEKDSNHGN